jgi:hypothetical protein
MDFSKYKFVVSSGCSYGRLADYVFNIFNYLIEGERLKDEYGQVDWLCIEGNKIVSINLSMGSQGSDWQSDSLTYVVDGLLKLGVKPENIFCLVEWSQWHRFAIHPPHHYGLDFNKFEFKGFDFGPMCRFEFYEIQRGVTLTHGDVREDLAFFYDYFKLFRSKDWPNWGKIEDRIYMIPAHTSHNAYLELGPDYEFFHDDISRIEHEFPLENKIKTYFDNILRTQYYLEKNKLRYNFLFMQSTLSDWDISKSGVITHPLFNGGRQQYEIISNRVVLSPNFNPINNPESDIEKIMPEIKFKMDQINFDNFWMYESERFRRGGIDEWAMDNMTELGYVEISPNKLDYNFGVDEVLPNYGHHPNLISYIMLWNKVAFNCNFVKVKPEFEKFIWEKYMEDYNYDGITKHNITLSKKEWDRITKFNKLL